MLATSYSRWTGAGADAAADGPSVRSSQLAGDAVSWMTTNGPLLAFDLVGRRDDRDPAETPADRS